LIFGLRRGGGGELADPRMEALVKGAPRTLEVSVDAIGSDGRFLPEYTCDGADKPPRVTVRGVPENARAVALIMYDPDAPIGTFIHWLLVAKASGGEIVLTSGSGVEGRNDFRRTGYGGPCPPRGHGEHRYYFLVLALDDEPNLQPGFTLKDLEKAVKGHVIAWGYTVGRYSR